MPVHIVTPSDAGGQHRTTLKNFVDRLRGEGRRVTGIISSEHQGRKQLQRLSTGEVRLLQLNDIGNEVKERMKAFRSSRGTSEPESEFHHSFGLSLRSLLPNSYLEPLWCSIRYPRSPLTVKILHFTPPTPSTVVLHAIFYDKAKDLANQYTQDIVTVGPFVFDASVLAWAQEELASSKPSPDCIVVDEIGPLEIKRGMGLEPAFSEMLAQRSLGQHIVVILRETLHGAFAPHFRCSDLMPIDLTEGVI